MEISIATDITKDQLSNSVVALLREREADLNLSDASLYYNFPLYRDEEEGGLVATKLLLVSPIHGIFIIGTSDAVDDRSTEFSEELDGLDHVFSHVYARLLKNRRLRKSKQELLAPISAALYAPNLRRVTREDFDNTQILRADPNIIDFISGETWNAGVDLFSETISTIEGAKGLIRPTKRATSELPADSKGKLAAQLEAEITTFDRRQKQGSIIPFDGPQRIRGLAGSGKTVVLAMKAALTHIREPDAKIVYTFWTKSLYQHVRRLITRFYRQFNDHDPDWKKLHVMHGWGSALLPGVYYVAATASGVPALTFQEASRQSGNPFAFACSQLLKSGVKPLYDYVFIDEGQDYPKEFIKLCAALADDDKFVIAYDELQTIFQTEAPSSTEIFGAKEDGTPLKEFGEDVVLHKCYRNPREILVCAHALGFGIYSDQIVQMLENKDHWEDIGYKIIQATFKEGSPTVIERPAENSLESISSQQNIDEIVQAKSFDDFAHEIEWVVNSIQQDLNDGLNPEDILVVTVDDRNAKTYLNSVMFALLDKSIRAHNNHVTFGESDFQQEGSITLSTVHKAKGNEAFMVYVVGVDSLFPSPTIRQRNMLFAAMTRAKGWLRVSGIAPSANLAMEEIEIAKRNFPNLEFAYPSAERMKVMRRDLEQSESKRMRIQRLLEEAAGEFSPDEIEDLLKRYGSITGKKSGQGRKKRSS